ADAATRSLHDALPIWTRPTRRRSETPARRRRVGRLDAPSTVPRGRSARVAALGDPRDCGWGGCGWAFRMAFGGELPASLGACDRSEEHTSELQSRSDL